MYKPDGGELSLSRRNCLTRSVPQRATKLLASDGRLFSILRPSRKYKPGRGQTVTNSSVEVLRCCVKVTQSVLSFPTLPCMSICSRSSRQSPLSPSDCPLITPPEFDFGCTSVTLKLEREESESASHVLHHTLERSSRLATPCLLRETHGEETDLFGQMSWMNDPAWDSMSTVVVCRWWRIILLPVVSQRSRETHLSCSGHACRRALIHHV